MKDNDNSSPKTTCQCAAVSYHGRGASQASSHSARKSVEWVMAAGFSVRIEVEKVLLVSDRHKRSLHHVESPSADG